MNTKGITFLFFTSLSFCVAADEPRENSNTIVKTAERNYQITYPDGGTDRFVYVFTAHMTAFMKQDGKSSSFKHPTDTRRCNYRVGSYIQRDGYYVTGAGARVPLNDVHKVYEKSSKTSKDNTTLEILVGQHSPCNNFVADLNSKKVSISSAIIADFDTLIMTDVFQTSVNEAESIIPGARLTESQKN